MMDGVYVSKEHFNEEEYREMWQELSFLCQDELLIDSKEAGGAVNKEGQLLRVNRGLPIESIYENPEESSIYRITRKKLFDKNFLEKLIEYHEAYNYLLYPTKETNLINHYMDNHKYDYHRDRCVFTAITIYHYEEKRYNGGMLMIDGVEYDLQPRDLLIFPSYLLHAVTPIEMKPDTPKDNMSGRISVSKFIKVA
jgi:hypothetical protein